MDRVTADMVLPICVACGTQFEQENDAPPKRCKICDDPRQYVPGTGQKWTTLADIEPEHKNVWSTEEGNEKISCVQTEPQFGIGQRAILLETPAGNILWDLITLLDHDTFNHIKTKGGLKAIVISHPHFYTTHATWAKAFDCSVYVAIDDKKWLARHGPHLKFVEKDSEEIVKGVTAIKAGGHFDGSMFLHWEKGLFIADTMMTVPSAFTPYPRPSGQTTFAFAWSIPNHIPMNPDQVVKIARSLEPFDFDTTYGGFKGQTLQDEFLKLRTLESMKIHLRHGGWNKHELLSWKW